MKPSITVDMSLMPENCEARGYSYSGEVWYSPDDPSEVIEIVAEDCRAGCVLGDPASKTLGNGWYGLYRPKRGK